MAHAFRHGLISCRGKLGALIRGALLQSRTRACSSSAGDPNAGSAYSEDTLILKCEESIFAAIEKKYSLDQPKLEAEPEVPEQKSEFLEVLENEDGTASEEDDEIPSLEAEEESEEKGLVEFVAKDEDPNLRESRYCYIHWDKLRKTIVNDCVEAMQNRTENTDLKAVLKKWDGMVGNQLVAAVINRLGSSLDAFAFFKFAGQQYNYRHDAISYSALINLLIKVENDYKKALIVFKHVQRADVQPDHYMMELLISGLSTAGETDEALEYLRIMWNKVGTVTPAACSSILNALFKAGKVDEACKFFKDMGRYGCSPDFITYNCMLNGLCKAGKMEYAVEVFEGMTVSRGAYTFGTMVDGFCQQDNLDEALKYVDLMAQAGHALDAFTYGALIDAYGRVGQVDEAYRYYEKMISEKCQPDRKIYTSIVRALSMQEHDPCRIEQARKVMEEMIKKGYTPNGLVFNDLTGKLCNSGKEAAVHELIEEVLRCCKVLDEKECTTFVESLCAGKRIEEALRFCRVMIRKDRVLDGNTFGSLFSDLCEIGKAAEAYDLFKEIDEKEVEYDAETLKGIIESLSQACKAQEAYNVYGTMVKRALCIDEAIFKSLISGFCRTDNAAHALRIYHAMLRKGLSPDAETDKTLIDGLFKAGDVENAEKLATEMIEKSLFSKESASSEVAV